MAAAFEIFSREVQHCSFYTVPRTERNCDGQQEKKERNHKSAKLQDMGKLFRPEMCFHFWKDFDDFLQEIRNKYLDTYKVRSVVVPKGST